MKMEVRDQYCYLKDCFNASNAGCDDWGNCPGKPTFENFNLHPDGLQIPVKFKLLDDFKLGGLLASSSALRYYYFSFKFPSVPYYGFNDLREYLYDELKDLVHLRASSCETIKKGKWRIGLEYEVRYKHRTDEIFKKLFGLTTLQTFYRVLRKKERCLVKRDGVWWCIPLKDKAKFGKGYRKNRRNEAESIHPDLEWLFSPFFDGMNFDGVDLGPERKPLLYVCNLCGRAAEASEWKWGSPTPGFDDHVILECPGCKAKVKSFLDLSPSMAKSFAPFKRWQDDYLLTLR